VFCINCGSRHAGRCREPLEIIIRKETGLGPVAAIRVLAHVVKNKTEMAMALGISRKSLYKLLDRYRVELTQ